MAKILIEHEVDLKEVVIFIFTRGRSNTDTTIMRTAEQIKSEIDQFRFTNRYKNLTYTLEELWAALESLIKGENHKWKIRIRGYEDKKRTMMHPFSPFSCLVVGFYLEPNQEDEDETEAEIEIDDPKKDNVEIISSPGHKTIPSLTQEEKK